MTGYIGTPTSRYDGRAKVTGRARYAVEHQRDEHAYAWIVQADHASGRVREVDAEAALRGQPAKRDAFARAADAILRDARGFEHNTFKIELARRAIVRTLSQAAAGTPQSQSIKKIR